MTVTVVANQKGGSGKSTIAFNLGIWLALHAYRVQFIDLDPQATLSDVLAVRKQECVYPMPMIKHQASIAEHQLDEHNLHYIIDVGAANAVGMQSALALANNVVIPVQPSQPDVWATERFVGELGQLKTPQTMRLMGFINRADTHRSISDSDETEQALRSLVGLAVLDTRIHNRTVYRHCMSEGLSVFELQPNSKAAAESTTLAEAIFLDLAGQVAGPVSLEQTT